MGQSYERMVEQWRNDAQQALNHLGKKKIAQIVTTENRKWTVCQKKAWAYSQWGAEHQVHEQFRVEEQLAAVPVAGPASLTAASQKVGYWQGSHPCLYEQGQNVAVYKYV